MATDKWYDGVVFDFPSQDIPARRVEIGSHRVSSIELFDHVAFWISTNSDTSSWWGLQCEQIALRTAGNRQTTSPRFVTVHHHKTLIIVWASPSTGHAGQEMGRTRIPRVRRGVGGPGRLPDPSFMRSIWIVLGSCWRIDSTGESVSRVPCEAFFHRKLVPAWDRHCKNAPWTSMLADVRPFWGYVGAMLPHLGPLLDHVLGDVGPSGAPQGVFGLCCFHGFTFIPKILLEKALPSGLRGTRSMFATPFLWKSWILLGTGTPPMSAWRLPPVAARFQETLPEGRKKGRRPRAASRQLKLRLRLPHRLRCTAWPDCMGFAQHRPCRGKKWGEKGREQ